MKALLRKIRQILRDRKTRRIFTRFVSTVAAIVVFVTTYALVLPAITMESEAACGIEAHQHDQSCYTDVLVCEIPESPGHVHDESCYSTKQKQVCQIEEHVHDTACYNEKGELICEKTEHQHGEDCFEEVRELVCEIPESSGHQHDDSCYQKVLTCDREVHTHSAACYHADTASQAATEAIAVASTESAAAAATGNGLIDNLDAPAENSEPGTGFDSPTENSVVESNLDTSTDKRESGSGLNSLTDGVDRSERGAWTSTEAATDVTASTAASPESTAGATAGTPATPGSSTGETAATAASTGATDATSAAAGYVPVLDELEFKTLLNKHTGIYYSRLANADSAVDNETDGADAAVDTGETQAQDSEAAANISGTQAKAVQESDAETNKDEAQAQDSEAAANTGEIPAPESTDTVTKTDEAQEEAAAENTGEPEVAATWNRIDKHTELKESDNLRLYLAYTIPAGSLNETNQTARYSLPQNIHLTDEQVDEINATVNGIAGQYVSYDTLEILDQEMYGKYLGIEAVEGTRTPADDLDEYLVNNEGQEFISATVKVENVFDENTSLLKAQDLVFTFAPYTIQKNQHQYDSEGQPTKAGEEVNGWLAIDISTERIDWEKADDETKTADIIFVEKDKKSDLKEISTELRLVGAEVDSGTDTNAGNAANGVSSDVAATDNKQDDTKDSEAAAGESDKAEKEPVSYPSVSFDDSITVAGGSLSTDTDEASADAGMVAETEITVHVEADKDTFPEGTTMVLSAVSDDQMTAVADAVKGAVDAPKTMGFHAVDISFRDVKGNEIEPLKPIRVSMTSDAIKRAVEDESTAPVVVHVSDLAADQNAADENTDDGGSTDAKDADEAGGEDGRHILDSSEITEEQVPGSNLETTPSANIIETDTGTKENNGDTLTFDAEAFSVYAIVYTVDFHWEVNGKMYDFSIKGGETLSLRKLLEILNVVDTEKSQEFIDHISTVEFTDPELICVAKIEEDITVGELKDSLVLEPEYSEEVSESELAGMNSVQLKAVDWALVSLKPFASEEWLTVSMTGGETFSIKVTDSRDPLGLDGRTFAILTKKVGSNGTSGHTLQAGIHTTKDSRGYYMTLLDVDLNNGTQYTVVDGVEYVRQDATAWKFEYNAEKEAYYISNNGKYLYIDPSVTSKNDTPSGQNHSKEHALNLVDSKNQADEGTLITITRDSSGNYYFGNKKGTLLWDYGSGYWLSNPENGENDLKENNAAIHLCLPENSNGSHKATLTAAKDLSVGQSVIVYKKVWNYETDEYDFFAVDAYGKLVKVWESSDAVYWKDNNGTSPAIEWKLVEATNAEGNPTGYLYLEQEVNGNKVYLSPHHDNNVVHSLPDSELNTVSISLPGRDLEQYGSRIATWDYDANTTYGLSIIRDEQGRVEEGDAVGVKALLESDEFLFAVRDPVIQKQLTTVDTVDSVSKGIKISMYNFSGHSGQSLWWNPSSNNGAGGYDTSNSGRLKYMNTVMGNYKWKSGVYWPNLVNNKLNSDGYPSLANGGSLKDIFEPSNPTDNYSSTKASDNANHLFLQSVYDSTGYYYYSGFDNFARLLGDDFVVYEQIGTPTNQGMNSDGTPTHPENFFYYRGNFLPFNELDTGDQVLNYYDGGDQRKELEPGNPRKNEDLYKVKNSPDYYFGMIMETKFMQGSNGLSDQGDPMVFEFTGDDDMWVYVDGVLLMDIGGVHDAFHGRINFQTGTITIDAQNTGDESDAGVPVGFTKVGRQYVSSIRHQFEVAGVLPNGDPWTEEGADIFFTRGSNGNGTFRDLTSHDLKMFYMERGAGASNLQIQFNIPVITGDQFQVKKEMPETVNGNIIQELFADAAFYYDAYITENETERQVTWAEFGNPALPKEKLAHYTDGTPVVWKEDGNGGYTNTFEIKPGQTAIFPVRSSQVKYRVIEVEPEPGTSTMLDNFQISNTNEKPGNSAETNLTTVQAHSLVIYENRPVDDMVNELQIIKRLHGNLYPDQSTDSKYVEAEETGSPYFEYKIYLESVSGKMIPYSLGEYYQIDGATGKYVYYDPWKEGRDKRCLAEEELQGGVKTYVYTYSNAATERVTEPKITEHTSQNGSIGDIRPGDTIIIKGLMEGTDFIVDERIDRSHMTDSKEGDWDNKYYYSHTEVEDAYIRGETPETSLNIPDNIDKAGTLFDKPDESGISVNSKAARGTILNGKDKDAKVTVHNEVNSNIPLQKKWPADSDDFNVDNLSENTQVTMTLKRYTLKKRTAEFTFYAEVSGGAADYDQVYTIRDQNGAIIRAVRYSQMKEAPNGSAGSRMEKLVLPVGTYTIERSADPSGYIVDHAGTPGSVTVVCSMDASEEDTLVINPSTAVFTSIYTQQTGSIRLTKVLANTDGYTGGYQNFAASYTLTDTAGKPVTDATGNEVDTRYLTYSNFSNGTASIIYDNLPSGEYLIKETIGNGSYNNNLYTVVNDPVNGQVRVTVTDNEEEAEFTSTYTKIQTQAEKKTVRVFKQNKGDYENGHTGGTLLKSETFYVGQQIKVTWTRQSDNAPFYYGFGGERVSRNPVRESASGSVVVESTETFIVPQNGIDIFLLPSHAADPSADKVSIVSVEPAGINNVLNSIAPTVQGTGRTYASGEAVGRLSGQPSAGSGDNSGSRGDSDPNTPTAINEAPDPETDKNQGLYYEDDDWSMEVTLKRGAGDNQFLILDSEGHTIGTFSQEITSEGSYWNADLTGINMTSDDGELYYYYISGVSEENVPDGMTPSIDTDTVAGKTVKRLYSKYDEDNDTGRRLSVTNSIIIANKEITIFKVIEGTTTPLTGAKFKLTRVDENGNAISGKDAYQSDEIDVDSSGRIIFTGLAPGRYKLEEKKIPAGYIMKEGPYYITVSSDGSTELDISVPHEMIKPVTDSDKEYTVENTPGVALPNTGGPGTRFFTILGSILTFGAGVLLWRRRRLI